MSDLEDILNKLQHDIIKLDDLDYIQYKYKSEIKLIEFKGKSRIYKNTFIFIYTEQSNIFTILVERS
jgi:hypothetical protein